VIDGQNRIHTRKVRTGRRSQGQVEILSGLSAGERVAVSGSAFVLDGDKVKVEAKAASGASK
jgi:HlyD family secretion protein